MGAGCFIQIIAEQLQRLSGLILDSATHNAMNWQIQSRFYFRKPSFVKEHSSSSRIPTLAPQGACLSPVIKRDSGCRTIPAFELRIENPGHAGGIIQQFRHRSSWPWHQLATTIRAHTAQNLPGAGGAECALKGTNQRIVSFGRQIFIATFTTGTQFKHRLFSSGEVAISDEQTTARMQRLKIGWRSCDLISAADAESVKITIP